MVKNIAILGATSHIAKNLIYQNSINSKWNLFLFVRNTRKLREFIDDNNITNIKKYYLIDDFLSCEASFDSVINCIGFGTPDSIEKAGIDLFNLTESIDTVIIKYLKRNPSAVYINFSSGAVYGSNFEKPVDINFESSINIQPLESREFYRTVKLNSEAKHRALKDLRIIDIRLFSFFSRFVDLNSGFLLTEIVKSLITSSSFSTTRTEIYRDYISPVDLFNLVHSCVLSDGVNTAIDTYSKKVVLKSDLLKELSNKLGLVIAYIDNIELSPTGKKTNYYSNNKNLFTLLGYEPEKTSIESVLEEISVLVKNS